MLEILEPTEDADLIVGISMENKSTNFVFLPKGDFHDSKYDFNEPSSCTQFAPW